MNGEYGFAFTKGFQEGDVEEEVDGGRGVIATTTTTTRINSTRAPSSEKSGVRGPRYETTYWKAAVVAKHFAAYSLETSTIPSYANRNGGEGTVRGFDQHFALEGAIGSYGSSREALACVCPMAFR
jgi:hypothetical protein